MIELRWLMRVPQLPTGTYCGPELTVSTVLQFRQIVSPREGDRVYGQEAVWSEWRDVPTVTEGANVFEKNAIGLLQPAEKSVD